MGTDGPRFPNKLVVIGVSFVLIGGVLLLWTAGYLDRFASLWPLLPTIVGLILLYFRVFRNGPDYYLFLGTSFLLSGILFQVAVSALPVALAEVWPFFLTVIGVALLLYGLTKRGSQRVTLATPGLAMLLLSFVFLPFSFELVNADFSEVVRIWWPLLLVVMGVSLIVAHSGNREKADDGATRETE